MGENKQFLTEELEYLEKTLNLLKTEIIRLNTLRNQRKHSLRDSGKDMWENSAHYIDDFQRLTEMNQRLSEVSGHTVSYNNTLKQLEKYVRILKSPYFGRVDFIEENSEEKEKIYIGLHNVTDPTSHSIAVYDWRAPISSVFYQYELGEAAYKAPFGTITGKVELKRQYKIKNSELNYFFDCSIRIDDEMLQEVLSQNSSVKMRAIIETIQREQDIIIRDTENDLLIVQGVAGSGKTSIALHRIAFLLYNGLNSGLTNQNILVVSPNTVFSKYISSILPELGEENVQQITFDDYAADVFKTRWKIETRNTMLEALICCQKGPDNEIRKQSLEFKGSRGFTQLLDRLVQHFEKKILSFDDVYYDGKVIEKRQRLRNLFLDNRISLPAAKRLKRIEKMLLDKVHPLQRKRLGKIESLVQKMDGHDFDIKPFSRMLSIKESRMLLKQIRKFTEIDYYKVYALLFKNDGLFYTLAQGIALPEHIYRIIMATRRNLENGQVSYEDCVALLYMKLKLEGSDSFSEIKQVVIDEAQDYSPMQYEVFKLMFKDAGFTVLGDINQAIEKDFGLSVYDVIAGIFNKRKSVKVYLNTSYRSSSEITAFTRKIIAGEQDVSTFERHEAEPYIVYGQDMYVVAEQICHDIHMFSEQGYTSIAVICKTAAESINIYERIKYVSDVKLIKSDENELEKGVVVIPSYAAKGLEFDVVLVNAVSMENYNSELDRRLLYIACTRALHRLVLYCTGEKSHFIHC